MVVRYTVLVCLLYSTGALWYFDLEVAQIDAPQDLADHTQTFGIGQHRVVLTRDVQILRPEPTQLLFVIYSIPTC